MSADIKFDQFPDARGMNCTLPILKTEKTVGARSLDQALKGESTNAGSKNTPASWAKEQAMSLRKIVKLLVITVLISAPATAWSESKQVNLTGGGL